MGIFTNCYNFCNCQCPTYPQQLGGFFVWIAFPVVSVILFSYMLCFLHVFFLVFLECIGLVRNSKSPLCVIFGHVKTWLDMMLCVLLLYSMSDTQDASSFPVGLILTEWSDSILPPETDNTLVCSKTVRMFWKRKELR